MHSTARFTPKDCESREAFNEAFLAKLDSYQVDLVVLAGFLVVIPEQMIAQYRNRIINIHPSLILLSSKRLLRLEST